MYLTVFDKMFRPVGPAQLPASHGERFPSRSNGDGSIPHPRQLRYPDHLVVVVHHVLVNVVADHEDVVLLTQVADLLDL